MHVFVSVRLAESTSNKIMHFSETTVLNDTHVHMHHNRTQHALSTRPSQGHMHVAVMDSAVPSLATPQPACCFRSIRSGLQQVRFLRKLMPGKGFYMDVLCYLLKAWKRCAVPAAIASCCHGCSCALLASRLSSLTRYGAVLSSCSSEAHY